MDTIILVKKPPSCATLTSVKRQRDVCVSRLKLAAAFPGVKTRSTRSAGTNMGLFPKARVKEDELFLPRRREQQLASNTSRIAMPLAVCFLTVGLEDSAKRLCSLHIWRFSRCRMKP